jgi:Ca2+:H+ antiporter
LLVFVVVTIALEVVHASPVSVFASAALAIVPLAHQIGIATEDLAARAGASTGGLLNATFANVTELIVSFFLVLKGEIEVVKASITGSIISNILLVLGLAFVVGGWNREEQEFNAAAAGLKTASLVIAVVALLMPALFHFTSQAGRAQTEVVSLGVSVVLIALYAGNLLFSLKTHRSLFRTTLHDVQPRFSARRAVTLLAGATALVALMSEFLVGALEPTVAQLGLSRLFVGLIVVPILGNAAENSSAVLLAAKDKMSVSIEIATSSSVQMALFVAPVLVFLSLVLGHPMNFIFTRLEIAAVGLSVLVLGLIALDGRSNWFEGAQMIAAYLIMAVSFFFL